jgi:hypothetical protein
MWHFNLYFNNIIDKGIWRKLSPIFEEVLETPIRAGAKHTGRPIFRRDTRTWAVSQWQPWMISDGRAGPTNQVAAHTHARVGGWATCVISSARPCVTAPDRVPCSRTATKGLAPDRQGKDSQANHFWNPPVTVSILNHSVSSYKPVRIP